MTTEDFKILVDKLNKQGKMHYIDGATDNQISQFEKSHGITLPSSYKEWLVFSDGGEFFLPAGVQMYGVAHEPILNVEDNNRPDEQYIVIGSLASGDPVLCGQNDEKIYIYDHEGQEISEDLIYEDYFALINDLYDLLGIGE